MQARFYFSALFAFTVLITFSACDMSGGNSDPPSKTVWEYSKDSSRVEAAFVAGESWGDFRQVLRVVYHPEEESPVDIVLEDGDGQERHVRLKGVLKKTGTGTENPVGSGSALIFHQFFADVSSCDVDPQETTGDFREPFYRGVRDQAIPKIVHGVNQLSINADTCEAL